MSSLASLIKHQPVAILDGATGTEVERRGYSISDSKLWSAKYLVKNPQVLKDIHFDYYRAGADICTTATYQASIKGLINEGVSPSDTSNIFKAAADVCADARDLFWTEYCNNVINDQDSDSLKANFKFPSRHKPLVAYSCGAFGASMSDGSEFTGDYAEHTTVEQLISHHRERLDPIRGHPGIDLLAFETIPCIQEAEAITRLLSTGGYGIPAWVSFSCKDGEHTCHGEKFAQDCVELLLSCPQVAAIGINCTAPAFVSDLLQSAKKKISGSKDAGHSSPALLCYPNSGEDWDAAGHCWKGSASSQSEPARFAEAAKKWMESGATIVGGCCRTTPEHIKELRMALL